MCAQLSSLSQPHHRGCARRGGEGSREGLTGLNRYVDSRPADRTPGDRYRLQRAPGHQRDARMESEQGRRHRGDSSRPATSYPSLFTAALCLWPVVGKSSLFCSGILPPLNSIPIRSAPHECVFIRSRYAAPRCVRIHGISIFADVSFWIMKNWFAYSMI